MYFPKRLVQYRSSCALSSPRFPSPPFPQHPQPTRFHLRNQGLWEKCLNSINANRSSSSPTLNNRAQSLVAPTIKTFHILRSISSPLQSQFHKSQVKQRKVPSVSIETSHNHGFSQPDSRLSTSHSTSHSSRGIFHCERHLRPRRSHHNLTSSRAHTRKRTNDINSTTLTRSRDIPPRQR